MEEQFLRTAVFSFPYKQAMLFSGISKVLKGIKENKPPSAFNVICQALFGPRFVDTAHFCLTCGCSSSQKRCKICKVSLFKKRVYKIFKLRFQCAKTFELII